MPLDGPANQWMAPTASRWRSSARRPVQPVAEEEALIPYPLNTFRGYRFLQEYFAFQDKFLFVDVNGLDLLKALPKTPSSRCVAWSCASTSARAGLRMRPTLDNVKLYCTPIANLFKHDALPIRLDGKQDEYLLLPAELDLELRCVLGGKRHRLERRPRLSGYVPFESFEHDPVSTCPTAVRITASASVPLAA
jgi:type VI secretion system protein ImpG